ncbi:uncharacterized protein LOC124276225 [Haliotis rubra]|uniref:uncharacterized protein LOC124276225 n=1 Tax=Haliotis rubra TaxID=36100 RepID=UPI001EE564A3|nr:uncharacterized protein LOC124276225 [Haliotis rubra]
MVADVSKITFTVTCGHHLVGIQCAAVYRNKMLISGTQVLFVHCTTNQESVLSASGQCFGAGLEVGITLCLVSLVAMGATAAYIIHWKRRNAQKDVTRKVAVPQVNAASMTTSEFGDGQRHKVYEPTQDTVNDGTYEPIQIIPESWSCSGEGSISIGGGPCMWNTQHALSNGSKRPGWLVFLEEFLEIHRG